MAPHCVINLMNRVNRCVQNRTALSYAKNHANACNNSTDISFYFWNCLCKWTQYGWHIKTFRNLRNYNGVYTTEKNYLLRICRSICLVGYQSTRHMVISLHGHVVTRSTHHKRARNKATSRKFFLLWAVRTYAVATPTGVITESEHTTRHTMRNAVQFGLVIWFNVTVS